MFKWVSQAEVCRSVPVGLKLLCASNSIHSAYSLLLGAFAENEVPGSNEVLLLGHGADEWRLWQRGRPSLPRLHSVFADLLSH